jgi:DNA repair protein RecO (recombination protein O)
MLEKDDGVVLKALRSGESSLLVTFLGRRRGKVRLMAKGVLAPKRMGGGLLEACSHVEVVYYFKENRSVYYLKEAARLSPPLSGRDSLPHLAARLSAMELLDQVCYPGSADEGIVDLAAEYVRIADEADPLFLFLAFELRLLGVLGAFPGLSGCAVCDGAPDGGAFDARDGVAYCAVHADLANDALQLSAALLETVERCVGGPLSRLTGERADKRLRKQLGKLLHWTYTFHVQGYSLPKSLSLI